MTASNDGGSEPRQIAAPCLPVVHGKLLSGHTFAWNIAISRIVVDCGHSVDLLEGEVDKYEGVHGTLVSFVQTTDKASAVNWLKGGPLPSILPVEV